MIAHCDWTRFTRWGNSIALCRLLLVYESWLGTFYPSEKSHRIGFLAILPFCVVISLALVQIGWAHPIIIRDCSGAEVYNSFYSLALQCRLLEFEDTLGSIDTHTSSAPSWECGHVPRLSKRRQHAIAAVNDAPASCIRGWCLSWIGSVMVSRRPNTENLMLTSWSGARTRFWEGGALWWLSRCVLQVEYVVIKCHSLRDQSYPIPLDRNSLVTMKRDTWITKSWTSITLDFDAIHTGVVGSPEGMGEACRELLGNCFEVSRII